MTEMVERVALALHAYLRSLDDQAFTTGVEPIQRWDDAAEKLVEVEALGMRFDGEINLPLLARAAIEAMLEPTEAMSETGYQTPVEHSWGEGGEFIADPDSIWRAMITAALAD